MFSLFSRQADPMPALSSQLYDERTFYSAFVKDLTNCNKVAIIESPYLTRKRATYLADTLRKLTSRGVAVRVNTREPSHHTPQLEQEAWGAIGILQTAGVKVFLCSDMRHRKLAVLDDTILWEGSLNILSQNNSREIMRRTVSPEQCRQMTNLTGIYKKH